MEQKEVVVIVALLAGVFLLSKGGSISGFLGAESPNVDLNVYQMDVPQTYNADGSQSKYIVFEGYGNDLRILALCNSGVIDYLNEILRMNVEQGSSIQVINIQQCGVSCDDSEENIFCHSEGSVTTYNQAV